MQANIPLAVVVLFFVVSLVIGLWSGRGTKTFKQFAVGDKNLSTATLIATIVATAFGGGFLLRELEQVYRNGLYYALTLIVSPFTFFFISHFMAPRMGEFMHHVSMAESMGSLFGKKVRIITAISSMLFLAGGLAIQLNVISKVFTLFCDIDGTIPLYAAVVVVLLYSTFGGIKAVTFTDVIQFMTFTTLIPVMMHLVSTHVGSSGSVVKIFTTHPNFDLRQVIGWHPKFIAALWLTLLFAIPYPDPASMQRVYMAKNVGQARSAFAYTTVIALVISVMVMSLAIALLAHDSNLDPKALVEYILKIYDHPWFRGFVCIGILALAMSTADSCLHAASVLLTHDIATVFQWQPKNKLRVAHYFSLLITLLALFMALRSGDLLNQFLLALSFYSPIVNIPFIMAIFGFRPSAKSVLLGMAAGALTVIAFKNGLGEYLHIQSDAVPAMFMNLFFLVGSYYILPKEVGRGWVGIKDKTPLLVEKQKKAHRRAAFKKAIQEFRLSHYLGSLIPQRTGIYFLLGIYCMVIQYLQCETWRVGIWTTIGWVSLASLLALYPTFSAYISGRYESLSGYIYTLLLFMLLFLSSSYMLSLNGYDPLSIELLLTNILVAFFLLPWQMVVGMVFIALCTMKNPPFLHGGWLAFQSSWLNPRFFYSFLFFISLYVAIFYWKNEIKRHLLKLAYLDQDRESSQEAKLKHLQYHYHAGRLAYENGSKDKVLPEITSEIEVVMHDDRLPADLKNKLFVATDRLDGYQQFIEESRYNREFHLCLNNEEIDIQDFSRNLIKKLMAFDYPASIIIHKQASVSSICADPMKLEQLFMNAAYYISSGSDRDSMDVVHFYILDTSLEYMLNPAKQLTKTLPALAFVLTTFPRAPYVEAVYKDSLDEIHYTAPKDLRELYKHSLVRIVNAHYGCSIINNSLPLFIILPVDLTEIRDDVMNKAPRDPYFPVAETETSKNQEYALEELLVRETVLSRPVIRGAIEFIKLCHGDQVRASGEPYYTHPMFVTELLLEETKDPIAILAALLHDVVEDSKMIASYIQGKYGTEVAEIVASVTHMGGSFRKKKLNKSENELHLRQFKDPRAVQIKIADRLHNVLTLKYRPREKQIKVAQQTLAFYIPLAESLGIKKLTPKLKKLCEEILVKYNVAG